MGTTTLRAYSAACAMALGALAMGACMQQPPNSAVNTSDQTQVQVGQVVPGPQAATQGTAQGGIVAGGAGGNVTGTVPNIPALQNIAMTLSVAAESAPDLCLSVGADGAALTALTLRSCSSDPLQKWVFVNGLMQSSKGGCLTINVALGNAAGLSPCDTNNVNQQLTWTAGQLSSVALPGQQLVLQAAASPATTVSLVNFAPYDASKLSQQRWSLGQHEHDATQTLVTHGVAATVLEQGEACLTGLNGPQYASCVATDANQRWFLTSQGFVQNEATLKCLGSNATSAVMTDCAPGASTYWYIRGGVMFAGNSNCLDVDAGAVALKPCDLTTSRHFLFGLLRGF